MSARHVVISGGASGLGLGCAMRFRRLGDAVTIVDRDVAALARAQPQLQRIGDAAHPVHAEHVDLAKPASVAALITRLHARGTPIDVLVNNAGIYPPARRQLSGEGHELSFAIAHLGHFRLTHGLWPLLEAAPAARIVNVSSLVQRQARLQLDDLSLARRYAPILAYRQTKLACLLFTVELQRRLSAASHRIRCYAAHPGVCRTQLGSNRARSAQDSAWQRLASLMMRVGLRHVGQSPENGAAGIVAAATGERYPPGSFVGPQWLFESFGPIGVSRPGVAAADADLGRDLWARSEALTGVRWSL